MTKEQELGVGRAATHICDSYTCPPKASFLDSAQELGSPSKSVVLMPFNPQGMQACSVEKMLSIWLFINWWGCLFVCLLRISHLSQMF